MSYIIRFMHDELDVRYVERLNGFAAPSLTFNIRKARTFDTAGEALKHITAFKQAAAREGSDATTIDMLELKADTDDLLEHNVQMSDYQKPDFYKEHSLYYKDGYGEPRGIFQFGKDNHIRLYMKKLKSGEMEYAYTINDGNFEAVSTDGAAIMTAMCKAARDIAVHKIRQFEERIKANADS